MKFGRALLCLFVIIGCVWFINCTTNPLNSAQIAQIEKLSQLKPYDMVMHRGGRIFMVVSVGQGGLKEKWDWKVTLRQDYMNFNQFETYQLRTLAEADTVEQIFFQDDPVWSVAAMCYLRGIDCREKLKQK